MSDCVEPDALIAFASGRLSGDGLERVESHLDGCSSCRAAMAAVAGMQTGATAPSEARGPLVVLEPGTMVGRYEIIDVAGAGGMGVIYRAKDPTLNRTVALKLVRPDRLQGTESAQRLLSEAQAMARVVHPEVLPVYDAGSFGDQVFIAMEWVEGRTLRQALRGPVRSWREIVWLYVRAGRGLAAAHRAGLVHRDFKPENVLLGDDGRVRVSDFGLAHDAAEHAPHAGTVGYMAPEVLKGEPATAAADQFSFSVALNEALRDAPGPVRRALQRGLDADPRRRHPSMDALVEALEREARPPSRTWAPVAALSALLAVTGLVAWARSDAQRCGAGDARVEAVWSANRKVKLLSTAAPADRATAARVSALLDVFAARWAAAQRQACEAARISGHESEAMLDLKTACLQQRLAGVDAVLLTLERAPAPAFAKAIEATQDAVAIGRCSEAAWLTASGGARLTADQRASAGALREELAQVRPLAVLGPFDEGRTRTEGLLARAQSAGVKAVEGEARLLLVQFLRKQRSAKAQTGAIEQQLDETVIAGTEAQYPHLLGEAWLQRMRACTEDGRFEEAEKAERHLAANLRALGTDAWLQAQHDVSLGTLLMREGRLGESLAAFASAGEMVALLPDEEARLLASSVHGGEALVHLTRGDLDRGANSLELAIAGAEQRFGPDHPSLAELHHNLGEAELHRGHPGAARFHVERAGQIWAAVYGNENPRVAVNLTLSAQVLAAEGRHAEALAAIAEAKRIFTKHQLDTQFVFMRALCAEGEVRLGIGDVAGSEAALRAGGALARGAAGKYPLDEAACHRALGDTLLRKGSRDEARVAYQRAIDLYAATQAGGVWLARVRTAVASLSSGTP